MFSVCSMPWFVIVLVLVQTVDFVAGGRCYTCSFVWSNKLRHCIVDPEKVHGLWSEPCSENCTMVSEYNTVSKSVISMHRSCGGGEKTNGCYMQTIIEICSKRCEDPLCNSGTMGLIKSTSDNAAVRQQTAANDIIITLFVILTICVCGINP